MLPHAILHCDWAWNKYWDWYLRLGFGLCELGQNFFSIKLSYVSGNNWIFGSKKISPTLIHSLGKIADIFEDLWRRSTAFNYSWSRGIGSSKHSSWWSICGWSKNCRRLSCCSKKLIYFDYLNCHQTRKRTAAGFGLYKRRWSTSVIFRIQNLKTNLHQEHFQNFVLLNLQTIQFLRWYFPCCKSSPRPASSCWQSLQWAPWPCWCTGPRCCRSWPCVPPQYRKQSPTHCTRTDVMIMLSSSHLFVWRWDGGWYLINKLNLIIFVPADWYHARTLQLNEEPSLWLSICVMFVNTTHFIWNLWNVENNPFVLPLLIIMDWILNFNTNWIN